MRTILYLVTPLLLAALGAGCAMNLATLQDAKTLEPGEVRISAGVGVSAPLGSLSDARDIADTHAQTLDDIRTGQAEIPDEATQRDFIRTAASLAVLPPEPVVEGGVRLGLLDFMDAGFEWSTSSLRGDLKVRLTPRDWAFALAILGGVEVYTFDVRLFDLTEHLEEASRLFEYVQFENPRRYDAEGVLIMSVDLAEIFKIYAAGKYRAGMYDLPVVMTIEHPDLPEPRVIRETLSGVLHYYGAAVGVGLGLPFLHVFAELNVGMADAPTRVLGQVEDLGGPVVYPAVGLALKLF